MGISCMEDGFSGNFYCQCAILRRSNRTSTKKPAIDMCFSMTGNSLYFRLVMTCVNLIRALIG